MTPNSGLKKRTKTLERSVNLKIFPCDFVNALQAENEKLLQSLVEGCDGAYGTLEQAISEMEIPRTKQVRSMATFKGNLQLGDPENYKTAICIPVERYYRTYIAKPPTASSFALRSDVAASEDNPESAQSSATFGGPEGTQSQAGDESTLTSIRPMRTYQIKDEDAPGGKVEIEKDDLAKGYEYGRTAVHISETDEIITTLKTLAAIELVGFIQSPIVSVDCRPGSCLRKLTFFSMIVICTCPQPILSLPNVLMMLLPWLFPPSFMLYMN